MPPATLTLEQDKAPRPRHSVALAQRLPVRRTVTERFLSHLNPVSADAPDPAKLHQLIAITFPMQPHAKCVDGSEILPDRMIGAKSNEDQDYWLPDASRIEASVR